ncbi:MAG: FGGY family carbohydrate kinase, partial [Desulfosalsimonas sp.]
MNSKDLVLAIDNGTQSIKVIAFDLTGRMHAIVKIPFEPYYSEKPGWAEQEPDLYWDTLCRACQMMWSDRGIDRQRIAGLSITTQRGTVVNVGRDGKPLRPAITWLDQRKTSGLPGVGGLWGLAFRLSGLSSTVAYFQREAEANWIRTHQPEIWNKTHKYLLLSGYLTYRLTGEFADSVGCQVGYIPFDYKRLSWARDSDWKWRAMPVDPDMLPRLVTPGGRLGLISTAAAQETGIPEGLPVIAAAADKACEVIGSGSLEPSTGCVSYGTTATFNV